MSEHDREQERSEEPVSRRPTWNGVQSTPLAMPSIAPALGTHAALQRTANGEQSAGVIAADRAAALTAERANTPLVNSSNALRLQAKLTVGHAGDAYERDADRVADQVMRMPATQSSDVPRPTDRALDSLRASPTLDGFDVGGAELTEFHLAQLTRFRDQVATLMKQYPNSFIIIAGHTDATHSEAYNEALGQRRAEAVRDWLSRNGVSGELMHTRSMGERMLKENTLGRSAVNRRVEITFTARASFPMQPSVRAQPPVGMQPPPFNAEISPNMCTVYPEACRQGADPFKPSPIDWWKPNPVPPGPQIGFNLDDAVRGDRIVRSLPEPLRSLAIEGLKEGIKEGTAAAVDEAIDHMQTTDQTKDGLKNLGKALLKTLFWGERYQVTPTPSRPQPPSSIPEFEGAPGEKIIKGPAIPF